MGRPRKGQSVQSSATKPHVSTFTSAPSPNTPPPSMQEADSPRPAPPLLFSPSPHRLVAASQINPAISESSAPLDGLGLEPESAGTQDASETHDDDHNKTVLTLNGDGFLPSHPAATGIGSIIRSHFDDAWTRWKKIPSEVVDMWFNEFLANFTIIPPDLRWAKKNFVSRGKVIFTNLLCKAHTEGKKPNWMGDLVWEKLCQYWDSDEFKKKSAQAKLNRAAVSGGSLHTCGSITLAQHKANLAQTTGVEPSPSSLFCHTRQRKDKTWVDKRAETVYETFERKMQEMTQKAVERGLPPPNEITVWRDIVGAKNKKIYGIGGVYPVPVVRYDSSSLTSEWVRKEELEEIVKRMEDYCKGREDYWSNKVKEVETERDDLRSRVDNTEKQIQTILEHISSSASGFRQYTGVQPLPAFQTTSFQPSATRFDHAHEHTTANEDPVIIAREQNDAQEYTTACEDPETIVGENNVRKRRSKRTKRTAMRG